jgi:hypothetical protein
VANGPASASACRSSEVLGDGALFPPDPSASAHTTGKFEPKLVRFGPLNRAEVELDRGGKETGSMSAPLGTSEVGLDVSEHALGAGGGGVDRRPRPRHERRRRARGRRRRRQLVHGGPYLAVAWEKGNTSEGRRDIGRTDHNCTGQPSF